MYTKEKLKQKRREWYLKNIDKERERRNKNKEYYKEYKKSAQYKFGKYRIDASRRGKSFEITIEDYLKTVSVPCVYCGEFDKPRGMDRIDNNIGYICNNVCSCCYRCNMMKSSTTVEEFLSHCKKIASNS